MFPLLFSRVTNVMSIYLIGIVRLVFSWPFTSLHYIIVDKDKYMTKLRQRQLTRERMDYTVGAILHMNIKLLLQIIFPGVFFSPNDQIGIYGYNTFLAHVLIQSD